MPQPPTPPPEEPGGVFGPPPELPSGGTPHGASVPRPPTPPSPSPSPAWQRPPVPDPADSLPRTPQPFVPPGFGPPAAPVTPPPPSVPVTPPSSALSPGYGYPSAPAPPPGGASIARRRTLDGAAPPPAGPYAPTAVPNAPGAPGGSQPAPSKGPRRRPDPVRAVMIVVSVVSFLFAGGGTVWLLTQDGGSTADASGDPTPPPGESGGETLPAEPIDASLAWDQPAPEVSADDLTLEGRGGWLTDDAFVRVMPDGIVSYDLASGAENWSLPFETSRGECKASLNADGGRIAILQGRDCEVLTVVDIVAGREVTSIPLGDDYTPGQYHYPAILGDTVAVGWGVGGGGYSISSGERIWRSTLGSQRCIEGDYAVMDGSFVSLLSCETSNGTPDGGAIRVTDEGGREQWSWEYGTEYEGEPFEVSSVVSLDPLVVDAGIGEGDYGMGDPHLLVVNEEHTEVEHVLDYDTTRYVAPCRLNTFADCRLGVVLDDHLFLATNEPNGDAGIVAFDLTTGRAEYEVPALNGGDIRPVGAVDGKVLAYQPSDGTVEGLVVAIDPATEEATSVMALDHETVAEETALMTGLFPDDRLVLWQDGTLVLTAQVFYEGDSASGRPAVLAYR
ncbi:PQQ-binding-like beta-propeller repeat protein [Streptomyces sp. RFCAC02]|uniref:PQQ-binding-like beta-propeller repeat protein n=1 Tax=Streptomyces sp. RFCAC02 TaxID=2499143 RepID=UPI00143DF652|nr:PQQ-binding-like beta-propeller repeat protein [Streptomyces sp. RFCAC02]